VDIALKHRPAMILMDVAMPGIDGLEAMKRIKTEVPAMPIVIASARSMASDRERFLAAGRQRPRQAFPARRPRRDRAITGGSKEVKTSPEPGSASTRSSSASAAAAWPSSTAPCSSRWAVRSR
jgi:CheY-like chemotaxis protein